VPSAYIPGRSADDVARAYGISPDQVIKLGSNENALGPSPRAIEAIKRHLNEISIYPPHGYIELKDAIGRYIGCSAERIIVGSGSDDLLNTLLRSLIKPGDQAIIPIPTYTYYEVIIEAARGTCVYVNRAEDFSVDIDDIIGAITDSTKLVIICAPNNPTGNSIEKKALKRLLKSTDALVVLDEAYVEFAAESHVDLVNHFDNLAVCRTFSKAFGLAGLRLGYALLDCELARFYDNHMLAFSVNRLAVEGGIAALSDSVFLERTVSMVAHGRKYLREKLPMRTYPTEANFVFVDTAPYTSQEVSEYLLRRGIIVRNCETFRGCSNSHIRITVGQPWQNTALLDAMNEFLTLV
jgi:histidinol-phosphate aminotransferase